MKERLCSAPVLAFPDFKLPFILTTDSSKVVVFAILSQVQNELECPIDYASRQLNNAERPYTVSEKEMSALVWATKQFRCYLFGKKFLFRSDNSTLKYLKICRSKFTPEEMVFKIIRIGFRGRTQSWV